MKRIFASLILSMALTLPASAMPAPVQPVIPANHAPVVLAAQGCGPYRFRDAWGYCRGAPYYGPYGSYYYRPPPYALWRCPPGFWRGPDGGCRNRPYRGWMPGGWYQP